MPNLCHPMPESNIIKFPQPAKDDLALGQWAAETARLAERVADLIETDRKRISIGKLLDRIESASEGSRKSVRSRVLSKRSVHDLSPEHHASRTDFADFER
jgi:hypothetical protein